MISISRYICVFISSWIVLNVGAPSHALAAVPDCAIAQSAIDAASTIRGLSRLKKVDCLVHDREQVKGYLLKTIETKLPPGKLKGEELLFRALGFIPRDFDYSTGIVDLYLSQLGGYYDPDRKHYVMASWLPQATQPVVAVHEMTHALQDQHFNLSKFMQFELDNSDELLARSAVVEGDATAVMLDYVRKLSGQTPLRDESNVQSVMMQNVLGGSLMVGNSIPESLQLLLLFPYTSGLRFAHVLLRQDGYRSIDGALKRPPLSTEEILHPEKYLAHVRDYKSLTDDETLGQTPSSDWTVIHRDTIGEFGTAVLLGILTADKPRASNTAQGWGGDRALVMRHAPSGVTKVVWRMLWDTPEFKDRFVSLAAQGLKTRYPNLQVATGGSMKPLEISSPTLLHEGSQVVIVLPQ